MLTNICKARLHKQGVVILGWLLSHMLVSIQALAEGPPTSPSINILYGAYEIVGRLPGNSSEAYRGWMRLAVEGDKLSLDRCIRGQHNEGIGELAPAPPNNENGLFAIKMHYMQSGKTLEATCGYLNDFQNLPRFSCHTRFQHETTAEAPGLEAAYPIVWKVPIDYFDCF